MKKKIIFIFGCQRSGTSATIKGLKGLEDFKIFSETNDLIHKKSSDKNYIRLKPFNELKVIFENQKEPVIVLKPLVESQNAFDILDYFEGSIGLWLYRDYKSVVNSMLKKWGAKVGLRMLEMIEKNSSNWRSEKSDENTIRFVKSILNLELLPQDTASIFWYLRNSHFFRQNLQSHNRICLIKYSNLVSEPVYLGKRLSKIGFQNDLKGDFYHSKSLDKGKDLKIHPIINQFCTDLFDRLNTIHSNS